MNNTVIAILIALGLFGVIAAIVFIDEGPPKLDFQEIVSEVPIIDKESGSTTTQSSEPKEEQVDEQSNNDDTNDVSEALENEVTSTLEVEEEVMEENTEANTESNPEESEVVEDEEGTSTPIQTEALEAVPEEEAVEPLVEEEEEVSITPPADFVLHLLFDEQDGVRAEDNTGHGNYGTLVNADTLIAWNGGQIDGGLFLDSQNDYVGIAHSETLNLGAPTESYTIGFWFRSTDEPGSEVQIIGKGGRSGPSPFSIRLNRDGEPSIRVSDGIDATTLQLSNSVTNSSWKHITAVRDGSTKRLRMYIDGIEYGGLVYDTSTKSLQNNSAVLINRHEAGLNEYRYHNFGIDDLRIYNRALSNQEILEVVNEGRI